MPSKEEIKKAVEETAEQLKAQGEEIEKGLNNAASNGGDDSIKSGTPKTETQELMSKKNEVKKSDDNDEDDKDEKKEKKDDKKEMKKSEEPKQEEKVEKSQEPKFEALVAQDEEENELLKAWRESKDEQAQEVEIKKSVQEPKQDETMMKALEAQKQENEELRKSISESNQLIKSLTEKVEKMASQPAYDKKSVDSLEPIEKSEESNSVKPSKGQVLNALLELQQEGIAKSHDITKYESTNQLSKSLQEAVKDKLTKSLK